MSSPLVKALDEEIEQLQAKLLAESPDYVKLVEAKKLRVLYADGSRPVTRWVAAAKDSFHEPSQDNEAVVGRVRRRMRPVTSSRMSPERRKILDAAKTYLKNKTTPTKTAKIFAYLEHFDVDVPGENPQNNLSAMLSNSNEFKSHGRAGWTLADVKEIEPDDDLISRSTSPGSDVQPEAKDREAGSGGGT